MQLRNNNKNLIKVLIETLWNVKTDILFSTNLVAFVLIETLWNVKSSILYKHSGCPYCINRNIVECKVFS